MSDEPVVKRGRGRPRKPRPEDLPPPPAPVVSDEEFFETRSLQPVTGKRVADLEADEAIYETLFRLGRMFCTQEEAAAFIGINPRSLRDFFYKNEEARAAWDDGLQNAKISLRRKQMALAGKLAPMAIFLGKNYLGQKDLNESVITHNKSVNELSEEDLEKIASRGMASRDKPAQTKH